MKKRALLFVPFWGLPGHVGNIRIERFIRWLNQEKFKIIVVKGGCHNNIYEEKWGNQIITVDPLNIYRDIIHESFLANRTRKPNKIRRWLSYVIFNPDPGILWAKRAAKHPSVIRAASQSLFILSSSPRESSHVGAWILSQKTGIPHIADMRDGWIDEPLKPNLQRSSLRTLMERRLEKAVLTSAASVFVTSGVWYNLLCCRLPQCRLNTTILTNAYPLHQFKNHFTNDLLISNKNNIKLAYFGRFTGSRKDNRPELLLKPLLDFSKNHQHHKCKIQLYGNYDSEEKSIIASFEKRFKINRWLLEACDALPRHQMLNYFQYVDGLLLLNNSYAPLPAKMFEYIPSKKPIFAIVKDSSAMHSTLRNLPQVFCTPINSNNKEICLERFFSAISDSNFRYHEPTLFSDFYVGEIFKRTINSVIEKYHYRDDRREPI